jgi:hypothetical protein
MKTHCYRTRAFLVTILLSASFALFAKEITREHRHEFAVKPTTTFIINSRYGNVVIESWDRNQIVIDVKITVEMSDQRRAEEALSYIEVWFSENSDTDVISATTHFNSKFNSIWNARGGRGNNISVNYNIKMPVATALTLTNNYGNTIINELSGLVNLNVRYGNLTVGKLTRGNERPWNNITLGYGNGKIEEAGWLTLNTSYVGNLELSKSTAVLLESKYSKINFGDVSSIVGESRYDAIKINNIRNLELDSRYTNTNIATLTNILKLGSGYGSLTVDNIPAGFESIEIDTRYAPVKLGIADNASYELNGETRYGSIKYDNNKFNVMRRIQENNSLTITGIMGSSASPQAKIKIDANYATVQLVK